MTNVADSGVRHFSLENWVSDVFVPQIRALREAVLSHMLPALPDAQDEAERIKKVLWGTAMSQPSDGSEDPAYFADSVTDQAICRYTELTGVRQGALNMAAVMLWHLLEQQMILCLRRELLTQKEVEAIRCEPGKRDQLCTFREFLGRLDQAGWPMTNTRSWKILTELRLAANVVKHAAGNSADELFRGRPDLFFAPGTRKIDITLHPSPSAVEQPAAGEDLYLTEQDLIGYFDAAQAFWDEFLVMLRG